MAGRTRLPDTGEKIDTAVQASRHRRERSQRESSQTHQPSCSKQSWRRISQDTTDWSPMGGRGIFPLRRKGVPAPFHNQIQLARSSQIQRRRAPVANNTIRDGCLSHSKCSRIAARSNVRAVLSCFSSVRRSSSIYCRILIYS